MQIISQTVAVATFKLDKNILDIIPTYFGYNRSINYNINYHYFISLGPFRPCLFRTCYDNSNPFRSCTKIFQSIEIKIVENPAIDPGSDHPIEECE